MELNFYKGWENLGTIKIGKDLMKKIIILQSFNSLSSEIESFPDDSIDKGNKIEKYYLNVEAKLSLVRDLSQILTDETNKLKIKESDNIEIDPHDNLSILLDLLSKIWNQDTTHFAIG